MMKSSKLRLNESSAAAVIPGRRRGNVIYQKT
jgi:hypothetical protein